MYHLYLSMIPLWKSLPARGVWIEICRMSDVTNGSSRSPQGECGLKSPYYLAQVEFYASLPARGVWIEIDLIGHAPGVGHRRSPQGECGLKYHGLPWHDRLGAVAPRKGSVD